MQNSTEPHVHTTTQRVPADSDCQALEDCYAVSPQLASELRQIDSEVAAAKERERQTELARLRELAKYD